MTTKEDFTLYLCYAETFISSHTTVRHIQRQKITSPNHQTFENNYSSIAFQLFYIPITNYKNENVYYFISLERYGISS